MFDIKENDEIRKTMPKKSKEELEILDRSYRMNPETSTEIEYSEVVRLFEKFLERKELRLKDLRDNPEKYAKLDGLLCQKIVEYRSHRSAFRNVFNKHGQIISQIWGIK